MIIQMRYPGYLKRAVTLSYDDGVIFDEKLIDIMTKYGLKGTFNVNSEFVGGDRRLTWAQMEKLYPESGNEVAVHGAQHLTLSMVDDGRAMRDLMTDRENLEAHFGTVIRGSAYANGRANPRTAELIAKAGLVYGRTTIATNDFEIPENWLLLNPTCHHNAPNLMELCDTFLNLELEEGYFSRHRPRLFYLWGHSYEFNDNDNWEIIENFAKRMGGHSDIWYPTNYELWSYTQAYNHLVYSCAGNLVYNPSATDVYLGVDHRDVLVPAGATVRLE